MQEWYAGIVLPAVLLVVWVMAGLAASAIPYTRDLKRLNKRVKTLRWLIYTGLAIGLIWGLFLLMWGLAGGWYFVEGTVKAVVPIMLLSHWAAARYILKTLRGMDTSRRGELPEDLFVKTAHPRFILSVHAAAVSSGIALINSLFAQPVMPDLFEAALRPLLALLILFVPGLFILRSYQAYQNNPSALPSFRRRLRSALVTTVLTVGAGVVVLIIYIGAGSASSRLPEASDMMNHHTLDEGGGTATAHRSSSFGHHHHHGQHGQASRVEVAALTGDISAPADVTFELVAEQKEVQLSSGERIQAWTYNGQIAPEIRVRQDDMVEVKLMNKDIERGVTIHWHGYHVPNAMDGVPGMTQNVVKPGQSFTYKFRASQEGTYWFHSHQAASEQVDKGLFGSLIVEPRVEDTEQVDEEVTVINHFWLTEQGYKTAIGSQDEWQTRSAQPGDTIKLRIINTHMVSETYLLQGASYRITGIDGVRLQEPGVLSDNTAFQIGSGGRRDVVFTMPDHDVYLKVGNYAETAKPGIIFRVDESLEEGQAEPVMRPAAKWFDPADYGKPVVNAVTEATTFDRHFRMVFGNEFGFYNGVFHFLWTINGKVYPDTPTLVVKEGEIIKTTFVNRSLTEHPMHLHGHYVTVLKKNGKSVKTPWMTDTLNVLPGEIYEVGFVADNPGMWMDHCHILHHAAAGMTLHLMYDNVDPSYEVGTRSGNLPD
jgi:FtsP/CotA-like multicopper oxidase with cupredoxin domain